MELTDDEKSLVGKASYQLVSGILWKNSWALEKVCATTELAPIIDNVSKEFAKNILTVLALAVTSPVNVTVEYNREVRAGVPEGCALLNALTAEAGAAATILLLTMAKNSPYPPVKAAAFLAGFILPSVVRNGLVVAMEFAEGVTEVRPGEPVTMFSSWPEVITAVTGYSLFDSLAKGRAELDSTGDNYRKFQAAQLIISQSSPIVLDLDRDGVETTALAGSSAHFDLDANGFAERVGWVSPDDGLLVRDLNGDGIIDDGTELFGTATIMPSGAQAANGFFALAVLDANGDGKVDASDSAFAQLGIWRDLNGDGKTDPGEVQSLSEAGVASLNTAASYANSTQASGAVDWMNGTYKATDGATVLMSDMLFQRDTVDSVALNTVAVPDEIAALPDIAGQGNVASLHQMMAQDQTGALASLVESFSSATTWAEQRAIAEQILFQWAGAQNAPARFGSNFSTGDTVDGRAVYAMGVFFATGVTVTSNTWQRFADIWGGLVDNACAALVAQTSAGGLLSLVTQDETTGVWDFSVVSQLFASWMQVDDKAACESLNGFLRAAQSMGTMTQADLAGMKSAVIGTSSRAWMTFANAGMRMMDEAQAFANIANVAVFAEGGDVAENIASMSALTSFAGGSGDDTIVAGGGTQWISGGAGNDSVSNVARYVYGLGDGHDTLTLYGGGFAQVVLLGVTQEALASKGVMQKIGNDLVLTFSGTDSITLKNWYQWEPVSFGPPRRAWAGQFTLLNEGVTTTLPLADVDVMGSNLVGTDGTDNLSGAVVMYGEGGSDTLAGATCANKLYGGDGNDTLIGNGGVDLLDGGAGDDTITGGGAYGAGETAIGGVGNDTIQKCSNVVFRPGDGSDTVYMAGGGTLKLMGYAVDTLAGSNAVRQSGNDLVLALGADSVLLKNWFVTSQGIRMWAGNISIDDLAGNVVTLTQAQVEALSATVVGTDGNDTISMSQGIAATVHGGAGNDTINGTGVADKLYGEDGDDAIFGYGGADLLDGGAGNDTITGGGAYGLGETAIGGVGNDTIQKCSKVVFRPGDGSDTVYMAGGGTLKLTGYAVNTLASGNAVRQSGNDLVLALGADSVLLKNWFVTSQGIRMWAGNISIDDLAGNVVTLTQAQVEALSATVVGTDGNDTISMSQGIAATVHGGAGNDTINGTGVADKLYGEDGDDAIFGYGGADLLDGGAGNDTITGGGAYGLGETAIGGVGNDTIQKCSKVVFRPGDGSDTVYMAGGGTLKLTGYAVNTLASGNAVRQSGNDLVLALGADSVLLKNWFVTSQGIRMWAGNISIDDLAGNVVTLTQAQVEALSATVVGTDGNDTIAMSQGIAATVHGGAGNDTINGTGAADKLYGEDGNDTIFGYGGSDLLDGGAGNDTITGGGATYGQTAIGGTGDDTISGVATVKYALGDGNDAVTFSSSSTLRLYGVTHQSLIFTRVGTYDLKMTMPDAGSILLKNFYNGTSYRPSSVVFYDTADMTTAVQVASWTPTDLLAAAAQGTGYGFAGADSVIATTLESGVGVVAEQFLARGDVGAATDAEESLAHVATLVAGEQSAPGAGAVVLNGSRQADNDVTWCLADTSRDSTGLFSSQMGTEMEALVRAACEAWEQVCGVHFTQVADNGLADIRLGFGDFDSATTGVIGYANMKQNADGTFAKDSVLRIDDTADVAAVTNENGELVYQGMNASVQQVLEHEIGHALGLASDADPNSVMYWKLTEQNRTLDATDVAGAQALYGASTSTTASIQNAANQLIQAMSQAEPAAQTGQNPLTGEPNSQPLLLAVNKAA